MQSSVVSYILPSNRSSAREVTPAWCAHVDGISGPAALDGPDAATALEAFRTIGLAGRSPPSKRKRRAERNDFSSFSV
jgi:hypothetical protein